MENKQERNYRRYLVLAPITVIIGVCMTSFAAKADYYNCSVVFPTVGTCTWKQGNPPSGYVCSSSLNCYPQGSPQANEILANQKPPKQVDRKSVAAPKTASQPLSTSNRTMNQPTLKTLNSPPPAAAVKQPCPTPGRC
jgi:hypothetical protein